MVVNLHDIGKTRRPINLSGCPGLSLMFTEYAEPFNFFLIRGTLNNSSLIKCSTFLYISFFCSHKNETTSTTGLTTMATLAATVAAPPATRGDTLAVAPAYFAPRPTMPSYASYGEVNRVLGCWFMYTLEIA